ncbi:MAG: putative PhzF superfamily epimerase YddE/YHI9 [Planctomycetota bacterium]|jgi:predicted PhzF superfamily epimerase YddE/YHI9
MVLMKIYQVDAFADALFEGNPAAVMPVQGWLPDATMQSIAQENNLSETAFYKPSERADADYDLRWFTPGREVDLCGHATLASAHVLFEHEGYAQDNIRFHTRSGVLAVSQRGTELCMDFPARTLEAVDVSEAAEQAIGCVPSEAWLGQGLVFVVEAARQVRELRIDMGEIAKLHDYAVLVTAPSDIDGIDFVSRFFAPNAGVNEDPVTGSAHCTLAPLWANKLGRKTLRARQLSARGGNVSCEVHTERGRVLLSGRALTFMQGDLQL